MQIERLTLKLLAENCYIYHNEKECIVFDPGSDAKVMCHKDDLLMLKAANESAASYGLMPVKIPEIDEFFNDNDIISFNNIELKVIHTPGHSAGSVCFYAEEDKFLISGDTLFFESVGRTDFPIVYSV